MRKIMLPIFAQFSHITIYTFGICALLGFLWGFFLLWKLIKLTSYKEEIIFDCVFLGFFGGLLFGRFTYIILNFSDFNFSILKFILINGYPGFFLYGALLGFFMTSLLFCRAKKLSFVQIADYYTVPLCVTFGFVKIGAFLSGGQVGKETSFPVALKLVGHDGARHPTALYEGLILFIGAYLLYQILKATRRSVLSQGFSFCFFLFYFSFMYLLLDNIKDDRLYFLNLSVNFIISAIISAGFSLYFLFFFRKTLIRTSYAMGRKCIQYVHRTFKIIQRKTTSHTHR